MNLLLFHVKNVYLRMLSERYTYYYTLMIRLYVISTTRELFIKKCSILFSAFKEQKMSVNVKKSGFMVINPISCEYRLDIQLESIWFNNVKEYVYLGVIFSETGVSHLDLDLHVKDKNKSMKLGAAVPLRRSSMAYYILLYFI